MIYNLGIIEDIKYTNDGISFELMIIVQFPNKKNYEVVIDIRDVNITSPHEIVHGLMLINDLTHYGTYEIDTLLRKVVNVAYDDNMEDVLWVRLVDNQI